MKLFQRPACSLLVCGMLALIHSPRGLAGENSDPSSHPEQVQARDGQHDFDFEIGTWNTHVRHRLRPLTGSETWVEMNGTTVVRRVWDGRANLVELVANGSEGRFEGLSLRLYNPESHQWSLHFASSSAGALDEPTVGEFKDGRGEFYSQEKFRGRAILVRFVISDISPNSCQFEQAFSEDGGKTWEVNWIAHDTRMVEAAGPTKGD